MIQATDLVKTFGDTVAVDNASFHVGEGEIVGFLGPNGAGKTTTLRILTCFMPATTGTATVGGYDVHDDSLAVRKIVGYMPENVPLYGEMRVCQYLDYRARLKGIHNRKDRLRRVERSIERCWIKDVRRKLCGHLSKGYRQRVGLADVLVHDPKMLILDEPTVGLDPNQIRATRKLMKELGDDHTLLISTHILSEVEMICDHIIIIHEGRIAASGTKESLRKEHADRPTIELSVDAPTGDVEKLLESIDGVESFKRDRSEQGTVFHLLTRDNADLRSPISKRIMEQGWPTIELHRRTATLEDIFVNITMRED